MSIEEELWCIFTNYTLMSNPTEPATLTSQQFLKLAKETQLVRGANGVAAAQIAIAAQLAAGESMQRHGRKGVALTFRDFMEVLARLAPGCHPSCDKAFAFQKALLENVLPLAGRRTVASVEALMADPEVADLLGRRFARGFDRIFDWYARSADRRRRVASGSAARAGMATTGALNHLTSSAHQTAMLADAAKMGYAEFLDFCETFKIFEGPASKADALLSVRSVGDAYLAATRGRNAYAAVKVPKGSQGGDEAAAPAPARAGPCVQDMSRGDFDEALLRLALRAYDGPAYEALSAAAKVRALFLYLWRAITSPAATRSAWKDAKNACDAVNANGADLNIHGSAEFNAAFLKMWQRDGFVDYTTESTLGENDGVALLDRIIERAADLTPAQFSRFVDDGATRSAVTASRVDKPPPPPSAAGARAPCPKNQLRVSDIKRLLKNRQDIADILHHQITDLAAATAAD